MYNPVSNVRRLRPPTRTPTLRGTLSTLAFEDLTGGGLGAEEIEGGGFLFVFFLSEDAGLLLFEAEAGDLFEDGEDFLTGEDFDEEKEEPILPVNRGF